MIKKSTFLLLFSLFYSVHVYAKSEKFSSKLMSRVQIDSLSFKDVMRGLYSGKMTNSFLKYGNDLNNMPNIGLQTKSKHKMVALMHPVLTYDNFNHQKRYLVMIEKITLDDSGDVYSCQVCDSPADLFLFKKNSNNKFQLVSKSHKKSNFPGRLGRSSLDLSKLKNNIQPIGQNLMGGLYIVDGFTQGIHFSHWYAVFLSETDYIRGYDVADAGEENGNFDPSSPLYYGYSSKLEVVPNDEKFFPIVIHYRGEMPIKDKIQKVSYKNILKFNSKRQKYQTID